MKLFRGKWFFLLLVTACFVEGAVLAWSFVSCEPVPVEDPQAGAHGIRIWQGPTLKSFTHDEHPACVPPGWEALGARFVLFDRAWFQDSYTGVLIKKDSFESKELSFLKSAYRITLRYPVTTPPRELAAEEAVIRNAFENTGALFNDAHSNPARSYTILVTAGLGTDDTEAHAIYPDVGPSLSFVILRPSSKRSEEYVIHAAMHAYNRFRPDLDAYTKHQSPLPSEDWQEVEAAWSEIALNADVPQQKVRANYLYNVHLAVRTHDFSRITEPPFMNKTEFEKIQGTLTSKHPSFLDEQYGHYVLAPLMLMGVDGLLLEKHADTNVTALLTRIHRTNENFFSLLSAYLSPDEQGDIMNWIDGKETIPRRLIDLTLRAYAEE